MKESQEENFSPVEVAVDVSEAKADLEDGLGGAHEDGDAGADETELHQEDLAADHFLWGSDIDP